MGVTACTLEQAALLAAAAQYLGNTGEQQHLCWAALILLGIQAASVHDTTAFPQGLEPLLLIAADYLSSVG